MAFVDFSALGPGLVISLIVSGAALFVSLSTLYQQFLRDADILLVNSPPTFAMSPIKKPEERLYIENKVKFYTYLVFLNRGARSGSVRVKLNIHPVKDLEPYYEKHQAHRVIHEQSEMKTHWEELENEFFLVKGRDSTVLYAEIQTKWRDWKAVVDKLDPHNDNSLCRELCHLDSNNKAQLQAFYDALKEGSPLATIRVNVIQPRLRRTLLFKQTSRERCSRTSTIAIGNIDGDFISHFAAGLEKWDNIEPITILNSFKKVDGWLDDLSGALQNQFNKLNAHMPGVVDADFCLDSIQLRWSDIIKNAHEEEPIIAYILAKTELDTKLMELDSNIQTLNKMIGSCDPANVPKEDLKDIDKMVEKLKDEHKSRKHNVHEVRQQLHDCHRKIIGAQSHSS